MKIFLTTLALLSRFAVLSQECPEPCIAKHIYVPNAFTPDGNYVNERWSPVFSDELSIADYYVTVFNQHGKIVWSANYIQDAWNGSYAGGEYLVEAGTYAYRIIFKLLDTPETRVIYGHVVVLR